MDTILISVLIGGIVGGSAVLAVGLLMPRKLCPKCNTALPRIRIPVDRREAILGGWHCPNCDAKIARNGSLISENRN